MRSRRYGLGIAVVSLLLVALTACEDTLTPQLQQSVRLAGLPRRQLTIEAPANGTATPVGDLAVIDGEPVDIAVTADDGFSFAYWEQASGAGTVVFEDENAADSSVSVTGGDAAIRAVITRTPRSLTVAAGVGGTVDPSGVVSVSDGTPRNITASPETGYQFSGWAKTAGAGSVEFANPGDAATTVTVTGGDAAISASFELRTYTITVLAGAGGSVTAGSISATHGQQSGLVSAVANSGNTFIGWEVTVGDGVAFSPSEASATVALTATGGDATIRANFTTTPRTLTVAAATGGTTNPSGAVTVGDGVARNILATPDSGNGYEFSGWEKTAGAGTITFTDAAEASTTVTLAGGDASIRANFALREYTITVDAATGGSTSVSSIAATHGVATTNITATPNTGYDFAGWTVTAGSGITFSPGSSSATVTVTATGGNATIRANFTLREYSLTLNSSTGGFPSPGGTRTVQHGVPFAINAFAQGTYVFNGWTKVTGAGTVVFADASSASTTVTVTNGNATIQPNFRKENVDLVYRNEITFSDSTTVPEGVEDIAVWGNYIYFTGRRDASSTLGVVRRINVSSPTSPSSNFNDYFYLPYPSGGSSIPRSMFTDGSALFVGSSRYLHRITLSNFGPSATHDFEDNASGGFDDVALAVNESGALFAVVGGQINGYTRSSLSGGRELGAGSWYYDYLLDTPSGLAIVEEDNGASQLSVYSTDIFNQGDATLRDTIALHGGFDMDPGWAGEPVTDVDGEYLIVPIDDENGVGVVRIIDITAPTNLSVAGNATVTTRPEHVAVDDYYIYVASSSGSQARVYVIDMASKSSPVVRHTESIAGFTGANKVVVIGNYVFVFLEGGGSVKPTLHVYEIVRS